MASYYDQDEMCTDDTDVAFQSQPEIEALKRSSSLIENSAYLTLSPEKQQGECQLAVERVASLFPGGLRGGIVPAVLRAAGWDVMAVAERLTSSNAGDVQTKLCLCVVERASGAGLQAKPALMGSQKSVESGVHGQGPARPQEDEDKSQLPCEICTEDVPSTQLLRAQPCGHAACQNCWKRHVEVQITSGATKHISCVACKLLLTDDSVLGVAPPELRERARAQLQEESFVEDSLNRNRWCPAPGCKYAVHRSDVETCDMLCTCGVNWCFSCRQPCHWPAACNMVKQWNNRVPALEAAFLKVSPAASAAGDYWQATVTKECPRCQRLIEKNGGCNFMHCNPGCGLRFCWECPFVCEAGKQNQHVCALERPRKRAEESPPQVLGLPIHELAIPQNQQSGEEHLLTDPTQLLPYYRRYREHRLAGLHAEQLLHRWGKAKRFDTEDHVSFSTYASQASIAAVRQLSECHYVLKHFAVLEAHTPLAPLCLQNRQFLEEATQMLHDALVDLDLEVGDGFVETSTGLAKKRVQALHDVLREAQVEGVTEYHAARPSPYFEAFSQATDFPGNSETHPRFFLHAVVATTETVVVDTQPLVPVPAIPANPPEQRWDDHRFEQDIREALRRSEVAAEEDQEVLAIQLSLMETDETDEELQLALLASLPDGCP